MWIKVNENIWQKSLIKQQNICIDIFELFREHELTYIFHLNSKLNLFTKCAYALWFNPQLQYHMEHPLAFITANKHFWWMLTSFLHFSIGIFAHSSCAKASSSLKSHQRFSVGFKSDDWEGHSRTFQDLFLNQALTDLAVCLGSLSCWRVLWSQGSISQQRASHSSLKWPGISENPWCQIHGQDFQFLQQKNIPTSPMTHLYVWLWGCYSSGHKAGLSNGRHTAGPCVQTVLV